MLAFCCDVLCGVLLPCPALCCALLPSAGIVHSVGGSDYGHVRVGTFMGLRIISQLAQQQKQGPEGAGADAGNKDGQVVPIGALLLLLLLAPMPAGWC